MRANGETATITGFDGVLVTILYDYDKSTKVKISIIDLYDSFVLNYAITIHKSQGSQYSTVIFFIEPNATFIINKSAVYTAISRAKNKCIIISNMDDFIKCQKNTNSVEKKVSLFMVESNNYNL